eukprot:4737349-Pyramimonas_sp.AAC.1
MSLLRGALSARVEHLCRSKLHPALLICIQDACHSLAWYLNPSSISYTNIDDMEDNVFLLVDHQITFHIFINVA